MPNDFTGEEYKKASTNQKEWGNKIIGEFHLKGNERILDLECRY
jgi:trans-aconitate 2-methyltransferase